MDKHTGVDSVKTHSSPSPSLGPVGVVPAKPLRESSSTKLKWNMLLQQTTSSNGNPPASGMASASPSPRSISSVADATAATAVNHPHPREDDTVEEGGLGGKKLSVDSTSSTVSTASSTVESLRSSLGSDWKVIGQPSGEPTPGHSRERALSLLERVSGSHLSEFPEAAVGPSSAHPANTRDNGIFSPFESGFDIRVSPGEGEQANGDIRTIETSRSSFPSIMYHQQPPPQSAFPFYAPQPSPPPHFSEAFRRQSCLLDGGGEWPSAEYSASHHRPSLSYGGGAGRYPVRTVPIPPPRPRPTPPPMSAYPSFPPRRSSVPHPHHPRQFDYNNGMMVNELETEMAAMAFHHPDYYMSMQHQIRQQQHQQIYNQHQPYMPYPFHQHHPHLAYQPDPYVHLQQQVPSTSSSPGSATETEKSPLEFQMSSYRGPLYAVEFKAGRTEVFYVLEGADGRPIFKASLGDLVIVEADRGEDLGRITCTISVDRLKELMSMTSEANSPEYVDELADTVEPQLAPILYAKEIVPKRIHRLATLADLKYLHAKSQEEAIAMVRCQSRIRQKRLPMEVVDAEYQWDRNKLTFYFQSDKRIDFRELVRDLFRIYKTRIWMCAVDKNRLARLAELHSNTPQETIDAATAAALAAEAECDDNVSGNGDELN